MPEGDVSKNDQPKTRPEGQGFGYSRSRVGLELGLLAIGLVGAVLLLIWLAGLAAHSLLPWIPTDVDVALGETASQAMNQDRKECENAETKAYVAQLGDALSPHFPEVPKFHFRVADDPQINAFALPGGFITVNMGLLENAEGGEEVAAVVAHEMAHVARRHGAQRILRQLGGFAVISMLFGGTDIEVPATLLGNLASTAYDREQESEADELGRSALVKAGISPLGMVHFFERLAQEHGSPPALLSTHPDPGDRASAARAAAQSFQPKEPLKSPKGLRCN